MDYKRRTPILIGFTVVVSAAILAMLYRSHFVRYMGDDFCTAGQLQKLGFIGSELYWYKSWTGRFSFTFLVTVAESFNPAIVIVLPTVLIAVWLAIMTWTINQLAKLRRVRSSLSFLLAELIVFAVLDSSPNVVQSFYWQTGLLTYGVSLIFFSAYVALGVLAYRRAVSGGNPNWPIVLLAGLTLFVAGGFNEVNLALQMTGIILAFIATYWWGTDIAKRPVARILGAGLIGTLLSLLVVILAPGTGIRAAPFSQHPALTVLVPFAAAFTVKYVVSIFLNSFATFALVISATAALTLGTRHERSDAGLLRSALTLAALPYLAVLSFFVCVLPIGYATLSEPPSRTLAVPLFPVVIFSVLTGCVLGDILSQFAVGRWFRAVLSGCLILLIIFSPLAAIGRAWRSSEKARADAAMWDNNEAYINQAKAQGLTEVSVPIVASMESDLGAPNDDEALKADPAYWINQCQAQYYGVLSIRGR